MIDYLNAQIRAGAQVVQIFDTWGGALSHAAYAEFSLAYMQKIVDGLISHHDGRDVPVILFTKGGGLWLEKMADTGCRTGSRLEHRYCRGQEPSWGQSSPSGQYGSSSFKS